MQYFYTIPRKALANGSGSLQIFLSTFFLAGLGVTVLIIYVMNPPVSNAIQGAYVTAVAITGILTGCLAVVFPEVTEALGCLLGGFCVSMWCAWALSDASACLKTIVK